MQLLSRLTAAVMLTLIAGCQVAAFPRTADIAGDGHLAAETHLQVVAWQPQQVALHNGVTLKSDLAFFPIVGASVRGRLGLCEFGGYYAIARLGPEIRCGLLQQNLRHPLSVAFSGASGIDYGPYFGPFARIGLDISKRFGPLSPIVNAYLSTGSQMHYIQDPTTIPIEGPFPGSKSLVRQEMRFTLPVGLALKVAESESWAGERRQFSIVVGAMPWFTLLAGPCRDASNCNTKSWDIDHGSGFSLGFEVR